MREKIKLVSSADTGHYYTTTKNRKNDPERMELRKFCRRCRQVRLHRETK